MHWNILISVYAESLKYLTKNNLKKNCMFLSLFVMRLNLSNDNFIAIIAAISILVL